MKKRKFKKGDWVVSKYSLLKLVENMNGTWWKCETRSGILTMLKTENLEKEFTLYGSINIGEFDIVSTHDYIMLGKTANGFKYCYDKEIKEISKGISFTDLEGQKIVPATTLEIALILDAMSNVDDAELYSNAQEIEYMRKLETERYLKCFNMHTEQEELNKAVDETVHITEDNYDFGTENGKPCLFNQIAKYSVDEYIVFDLDTMRYKVVGFDSKDRYVMVNEYGEMVTIPIKTIDTPGNSHLFTFDDLCIGDFLVSEEYGTIYNIYSQSKISFVRDGGKFKMIDMKDAYLDLTLLTTRLATMEEKREMVKAIEEAGYVYDPKWPTRLERKSEKTGENDNVLYNLKLTQRQLNLLLFCIFEQEGNCIGFDSMTIGDVSDADGESVNLNFRDFVRYYNAYAIKCRKIDVENHHDKLQNEVLVEDDKNNPNWIGEFEPCNLNTGIRKVK